MKKLAFLSIILGSSLFSASIFSQNNQNSAYMGLPGDNFNLYGVLNLFQESETLELFEQKLNAEDSRINNLDLDGDGRTDYIKVIDYANGNAHTIVLQDIINERETQDVAVIEVNRDQNGEIQIQIIGDENLYGKDYIVEPMTSTPNPGYNGNNANTSVIVYAPARWSIIRYIYTPSYVVYVSPWRWSYYPTYWHPWHQIHYYDYHNHWNNHQSYSYYHKTNSYRVPAAQSYYGPRRSTSVVVRQRIDKGDYKRSNIPANSGSQGRDVKYSKPQQNNAKNSSQPNRNENSKVIPEKKSNIQRGTPSDKYNQSTTPTRSERKPEVRSQERSTERQTVRPAAKQNDRPSSKQNDRPAVKQNERPAVKQNERPAAKQNERPATQQEKSKDSKRK